MVSAGQAVERDIPVVILCGGEGTRFQEDGQYRPKPLAERKWRRFDSGQFPGCIGGQSR